MPPRNNMPPVFNPREGNEDYFFYAATVTGLQSTAASATSIINIDADSDFLCTALSYQAVITTAGLGALVTEATNVIPVVTLQINDTGSGKSLMNQPVPLGSIAGDGKRPYRLPRPRVFQSNATVQLNWLAYVVAGTIYQINFVMHGIKQYK
jgi:hypothetical protein